MKCREVRTGWEMFLLSYTRLHVAGNNSIKFISVLGAYILNVISCSLDVISAFHTC